MSETAEKLREITRDIRAAIRRSDQRERLKKKSATRDPDSTEKTTDQPQEQSVQSQTQGEWQKPETTLFAGTEATEDTCETVSKQPGAWDELQAQMTPELARIVKAWKSLPEELRAEVLSKIDAVGTDVGAI